MKELAVRFRLFWNAQPGRFYFAVGKVKLDVMNAKNVMQKLQLEIGNRPLEVPPFPLI